MPKTDLPALLPPDLKPVPAEYEPAWEKIQQRENRQMQQALYLVALGLNPNEANQIAGYAEGSAITVYQKARHYGLYRPRAERIAQQALEVADLSGTQLIETLSKSPDKIDPKQMAVLWGIAQDKVMKKQQLDRDKDRGNATSLAMQDLLEQLLERGYSANLELKPPSPEQQAIDVQPLTAAEPVEEDEP